MDKASIVVPAYNAERTLGECLQAATTIRWSGELEIILVNDGSNDRTGEIAASFSGVTVIDVPHGGAARAINVGIRAAHHDVVVLLDADAVPEESWLEKIIPSFDSPVVAAVGGRVVTANRGIIGKIAGYDVELRQGRVPRFADHLSTANTAYRRETLLAVGLLNEQLKAGYDVDLSRRIKAAGYCLILRKDVTSKHYWKDDLSGYLRQQYNYAYYRLELAQKFGKPHNQMSGLGMVLQVPFSAVVLLAASLSSLVSPQALLLLLLLPSVHLPQTFRLLISKRDASVLLLPLLFTIRNLCWVGAAIVWGIRRVSRGYIA